MPQRLYLLVGYPGAGKTTVSKLIHAATGAEHIWADHERHKMFAEPTHALAESHQLYERLNHYADDLLASGESVIFDTNFNYRKDRQLLRSIADKYGAETIIVWITTSQERAKQRAVAESHGRETRVWGNMPAEQFDRIASNLEPPTEDETYIKIDGSNIDEADLKRQLGI